MSRKFLWLSVCAFCLAVIFGLFRIQGNSVRSNSIDSSTVLTFSPPNKVIYITQDGSDDTGDGSQEKPLRSLVKAFETAKRDTLIKMGVGRFAVKQMITVPSHVSLEGAGAKTIIVPSESYQGVLFEAKDFDKLEGDGFQYYRNFQIDGKDKAELGFRAWGREKSLFENITFINFNNAGVDITGSNNEISNCRFINAAGREGDKNQHFSGAIRFMDSDSLLIHDNYIEEDTGGGIKSVASKVLNTQIYNNKINIIGTKSQPVNKSAAIEIWDLREGNKIYNNDLNAWVSLINQWGEDKDIAASGNLMFYKNNLQANPGVTDDMSGLEVGMKGAEFSENTFVGFKHRIFWIEGWGGKKKPTKDISIHDNKFQNCGNAMNLGPNGNGVANLKFYNNMIDNCNGVSMGMGNNKKLINISITNNTFINAKSAVSLSGNNKQYVNLQISENKAYKSQVGLNNQVEGLNVNSSNAVSLK